MNRVKTDMTGSGTVLFNLDKGIPNKVVMNNSSTSKVTPIKGGAETTRSLKSTLRLVREGFADAPVAKAAPPANWQEQVGQWWNIAVATGQNWWNTAAGYLAMAKRSEDHQYLQTVSRPVAAMAKSYPAGYAGYMHSHARAQLLYAASGTIKLTLDSGHWIVPPRTNGGRPVNIS